jgi:CBS-domain-containing membrane protein
LRAWLGVELDEVSWAEKAVSVLGGVLSILAVMSTSEQALGLSGASMLIASMGASAVLLFAVPHGQLSQPWPVLAGHVGSAAIGVTCAKLVPNTELAAGCAVGLAIGAMHQFRFIHPPGGATALTAVIAGPAVDKLGYGFVVRPVLLNATVIVLFAVVFNAPFAWRRYPAQLARRGRPRVEGPEISHEQVVAALRSLDSFVDITEDDLVRLTRILAHSRPTERAAR